MPTNTCGVLAVRCALLWLCALPPGVLAQWRLVKIVRPAACKCTAGRTSSKQVHSSGGQLQEFTLAFCSYAATEAWTGYWCSDGGIEEEGLRHQISGRKLVKSAKGLQQLYWSLFPSVEKAVGFICQAGLCELQSLLLCGCYW